MEDFESEEGGAERRAEEHCETGGHSRDRQGADVGHWSIQLGADHSAEGSCGLRHRSLGSHAGTGRDTQQGGGDERPKRLHILGATQHMYVAHEQFHIAGFATNLGDERNDCTDDDEDEQGCQLGVMLRSDKFGHQVEDSYVRCTNETADDSYEDDRRAKTRTNVDYCVREGLTPEWGTHRHIVPRYKTDQPSRRPGWLGAAVDLSGPRSGVVALRPGSRPVRRLSTP